MAASAAQADTLRVATWHPELTRKGPALLLQDILDDEDEQLAAALSVIDQVDADVLLLTSIDTDFDGHTARAFAEAAGYPHVFTRAGNTGRPTGRDIDRDGRLGEPEDAQSYGEFTGQGGMALLSRLPVDLTATRDYSDVLWRDIPDNRLPVGYFDAKDLDVLRLSSSAHWDVVLDWEGTPLHLLTLAATAPVFDGVEDRNGRRNADEVDYWRREIAQNHGPDGKDFVLLGNTNLDPYDGQGWRQVMADLLASPHLQDPAPRAGARAPAANADHSGDPALDTADWDDPVPGNLRVDYVLPASVLKVLDAGVLWVDASSVTVFRHGLVWVDIAR